MACAAAVAIAAAGAGGCVQPAQRVELEEPAEPVDVIQSDDYSSRIAGLRATLARNGIAIDTQPEIETCNGSDTKGRCVKCDLATRERTSGLDPDLLDAVSIAFGRYPPGTLAKANIQHVALCRKIRFSGSPDDGPAGLAMLGERRVLVSVEHFIGDHAYDSFTIEQEALNPPGFAYEEPKSLAGDRPVGFVDRYALTSDAEDRASTFEVLMSHPQKLCEYAAKDPVLAKKVKIVWKRIAPIVGEAHLKRWAGCAKKLVK